MLVSNQISTKNLSERAPKPDIRGRSGPGILVLTSTRHVLFQNQEAAELCRLINRWQVRQEARGVIPADLVAFCEEIHSVLHASEDVKEWEQFQLQRMIGDPDAPILLRGFGLLDPEGMQPSRVLIIMEKVGHRKAASTEKVKEQYQMTDREEAVLQQLANGLTNKEIALLLGISEQTVKEHVRHIMHKTGTTTRTGMLGRVLMTNATPGAPEQKPVG